MASLKNAHQVEKLSVEFANGDTPIGATSMHDVRTILAGLYGPNYVENEDWESAGNGRQRLLIWANDTDAQEDDGSNSVAHVIRINYDAREYS